jgi:hypothetical protein
MKICPNCLSPAVRPDAVRIAGKFVRGLSLWPDGLRRCKHASRSPLCNSGLLRIITFLLWTVAMNLCGTVCVTRIRRRGLRSVWYGVDSTEWRVETYAVASAQPCTSLYLSRCRSAESSACLLNLHLEHAQEGIRYRG